tara:strand:- start:6161 stop:8146 length:1986 start_codon:yes stop_codon:yes gene_type:complete
MTTKKLNIDILARDKSKQALSQVQTRLGNLRKSVFSLRSAFIGLGAGLAIRSFVNVGKEVESLKIRFKFLFGSAEEGAKAFDNLAKFAGTVPFSLEEISRASGNLAVVSKDADDLNRVLEITGNVAAVTGLDFETTSSQIQRAFAGGIGAADLFRERGVRALLGFEAGAKVSAEETVKRFEELFSGNGRFAGATNDLATTLEGTISMLGDKFFNFQKDVAEEFFDELKGEFGDLNVFLEQNEQQIEDIAKAIGENFAGAIQKTSKVIKDLAPATKNIADSIGTVITGFTSLPPFVQSSGIIAALLFGKKGAIAFTSLTFLVGQIQEILDQAGAGTIRPLIDIDELQIAKERIEQIKGELELLEPKTVGIAAREEDKETVKNLRLELKALQESVLRFNFEQGIAEFEKLIDQLQKTEEGSENLKKEQVKLQQTLSISKNMLESGAKAQAKLSFVQKQNTMTLENFRFEFDKFNETYRTSISQTDQLRENFPRFTQTLKDAGDTTKQLDGLFTNTFNNFADTLADSIMTGKFAFKDFARSVIADIARMIAKQQALIAIQKVAGLFGGSIGGFNIGSLLPAMSSGGRVNKGMPVSVGEAGREIFIPQSSGTIVPNNQTGGSTNINFTINTVDATGVDELLTNRRSTIINVINDALNRQGKEALV